jgi:CspA family cold shock protein
MVKGHVKWFSNPKGYGFILMDDASEVFVHHSLIVGEGYKTLKEGEEVTFELIETEKGKQAHKVTRLPGASDEAAPAEARQEPVHH